MARTLHDSLRWTAEGTRRFLRAVNDVDRSALDAPSLLPGWTRAHVVAHVAANATALRNLVRWAQTGEPTPMYTSPEQRSAEIESGASMSALDMRSWTHATADALQAAWTELTTQQWATKVVTAQGREVPASEIPWLRAREVSVHLIDLDLGAGFADLPPEFLEALRADVIAKRGDVPSVDTPLAAEVSWLTGRPHQLPHAPPLPPWL